MKQTDSKKHVYYVGLKGPREIRRSLLESSKSMISAMQTHQKLLEIKKEKEAAKNKLKEDVRELKMLFSKLEKLIPENAHANEEKPVISEKKQAAKPKTDIMQKEIDRIHSQISMIEDRLKYIK